MRVSDSAEDVDDLRAIAEGPELESRLPSPVGTCGAGVGDVLRGGLTPEILQMHERATEPGAILPVAGRLARRPPAERHVRVDIVTP